MSLDLLVLLAGLFPGFTSLVLCGLRVMRVGGFVVDSGGGFGCWWVFWVFRFCVGLV